MTITYPYKNLVFKDKNSKAVLNKIYDFAKAGTPLLFIGANGTGKKEFAKIYHYTVYKEEEGFININSSNLDDEIGYSSLFGYKKGAFTGAEEDKEGILATKKTVYFSSVENLPQNLLPPIINLLETGEYYPLGSQGKKRYKGVLLFSSKLEIDELKGTITDSFYFYIKPFVLRIPNLSEREKDIIPLINCKLKQLNEKNSKNKRISSKLSKFILQYEFKGNIRQLFNYIERGFIESGDRETIEIKDMFTEQESVKTDDIIKDAVKKKVTLLELQKRYILEIYKETGGSREKMAKILGITTRSVYNHLKKYGIIDGKD